MTPSTSLLRCAHCGIPSFYELELAERDRGDWILRCPVCDAENVLTTQRAAIHIAGWRE